MVRVGHNAGLTPTLSWVAFEDDFIVLAVDWNLLDSLQKLHMPYDDSSTTI